jgi:acetyltransferase
LDARIVIDKERVLKRSKPYTHLVISPYPSRYEDYYKLQNGQEVFLRPIKPEDEPLVLALFHNLSDEAKHHRFFQVIEDTPHEIIVRYCNIDYNREMTIIAELVVENQRKIIGIARLLIEAGGETGELGFIVSDSWHGLGLSKKFLDNIIEIAKDNNLSGIYANICSDNQRVIQLLETNNFTFQDQSDSTVKANRILRG